jgi:hypothetical protein
VGQDVTVVVVEPFHNLGRSGKICRPPKPSVHAPEPPDDYFRSDRIFIDGSLP